MSISVNVYKEITEYKEKIIFGLSIRQLICFSSAVILGIGSYFLCTKVFGMSMDGASYVIIIESMPLMALGFIKKNGMTFEKYAALYIRHKIGINELPYKTELIIDDMTDLDTDKNNPSERTSKYAWIFEKENNASGNRDIRKRSRKDRRQESKLREYAIPETTKEGRKRKI